MNEELSAQELANGRTPYHNTTLRAYKKYKSIGCKIICFVFPIAINHNFLHVQGSFVFYWGSGNNIQLVDGQC